MTLTELLIVRPLAFQPYPCIVTLIMYKTLTHASQLQDTLPLSGAPVAWRSAQQTVTALSTCVAEFYALTEATVQVIWHRQLLKDLHFEQTEPTVIQEDNQAAIAACEYDVVTRRIKCVGVRLGFLRDQMKEGVFELEDCPSRENIADIFTKALPISTFEYHAARM